MQLNAGIHKEFCSTGRRGGSQIAAGLALGKTMVEEMMAMEVKVSAAGNE